MGSHPNDSHVPIKIKNEVAISKPSQEQEEVEKEKTQLNVRAIYYLHCVLDKNKYIHIC